MAFDPVPINSDVKVRDTMWIQVCPNCQCEREVSYAQSWNIKKGNTNKECRPCGLELELFTPNYEGLKLGRKKWEVKKSFSNKGTFYRNLFNNPTNDPEVRKKQSQAKLGKKGELANNWRGGLTPINRIGRSSIQYSEWRLSVFKRDNFACMHCKVRGKKLNAHHIKHWAKFVELRFEIDNGITLCVDCHKKEHKKNG